MATKLNYVFVYGTLKKNEPNFHWFSKNESSYYNFVCNAETSEKYPLIIATKYNIPFLLYKPGVGYNVSGEVYEVNDVVLKALDILEEHPQFYTREEHLVKNLDTPGNSFTAWIYFIKKFKPALLCNKLLSNYSSNDNDHGLQYVCSEAATLDDLN